MRYLLILDHLGLGGAQRQAVELACGLRQRGHDVEVFVYFPRFDYFRRQLEERQIAVHEFKKQRGFSIRALARLAAVTRGGNFDVVISYLNNPNLYAELTSLVSRNSRLIVSERCSHHDDTSWLIPNVRRLLHTLADSVVTNSETHASWLRRKHWLTHKVVCIYNGIALGEPIPRKPPPKGPGDLRLLAIGRICPQKNLPGLIGALDVCYREHGHVPSLSWIGKPEAGRAGTRYQQQVLAFLSRHPHVENRWHWLGEQTDMGKVLQDHDVLIHPSLYEGLPNAVCEALAAGMPVLASNVCDHPRLVADGERGYIFDPKDPRSISAAVGKITTLDAARWDVFCSNARRYAEESLSSPKMVQAYEDLSLTLMQGRA